jgi:hypothetical protein
VTVFIIVSIQFSETEFSLECAASSCINCYIAEQSHLQELQLVVSPRRRPVKTETDHPGRVDAKFRHCPSADSLGLQQQLIQTAHHIL